MDSGQDLMPTDVAHIDVILELLEGHPDPHGNGDFLDRSILVLEGLHSLVPQRWVMSVLKKQLQLPPERVLGSSSRGAADFCENTAKGLASFLAFLQENVIHHLVHSLICL